MRPPAQRRLGVDARRGADVAYADVRVDRARQSQRRGHQNARQAGEIEPLDHHVRAPLLGRQVRVHGDALASAASARPVTLGASPRLTRAGRTSDHVASG